MAYKLRHANLFDLLSISASRGKQRVLRLNPPYTLVQPEALLTGLLKSQIPLGFQWNFVYVYREGGRYPGLGAGSLTLAETRRVDDHDAGGPDKAPTYVWERLLEEVIRQAGEQGVIRLFAKLPEDEPQLHTFRMLGFTRFTDEEIWGNLYFGRSVSPER